MPRKRHRWASVEGNNKSAARFACMCIGVWSQAVVGHRPGMSLPVKFNLLSSGTLVKRTAPKKCLTKPDGPQLNSWQAGRQSPRRWKDRFISHYKPEYLRPRYQGGSLWYTLTTSWPLFGFAAFSTQMKGASSPAVPVMPAAKPLICRVPSSVEAINHELENVFIREGWEHGIQVGARLHLGSSSRPPDGPRIVFIKLLFLWEEFKTKKWQDNSFCTASQSECCPTFKWSWTIWPKPPIHTRLILYPEMMSLFSLNHCNRCCRRWITLRERRKELKTYINLIIKYVIGCFYTI